MLEKYQSELEELQKYVICIDHITNPFGIYKEVRNYMKTIGTDITTKNDNGEDIPIEFKYNNDEDMVFVVVDHFTAVSSEQGKTDWENLKHFSQEYLLNQLTKRYKCCVVSIHQQASETERVEFWQGEALVNKLKPTLNGLGKATKIVYSRIYYYEAKRSKA